MDEGATIVRQVTRLYAERRPPYNESEGSSDPAHVRRIDIAVDDLAEMNPRCRQLVKDLIEAIAASHDSLPIGAERHMFSSILGQLLKGELAAILLVMTQIGRLHSFAVGIHGLVSGKAKISLSQL